MPLRRIRLACKPNIAASSFAHPPSLQRVGCDASCDDDVNGASSSRCLCYRSARLPPLACHSPRPPARSRCFDCLPALAFLRWPFSFTCDVAPPVGSLLLVFYVSVLPRSSSALQTCHFQRLPRAKPPGVCLAPGHRAVSNVSRSHSPLCHGCHFRVSECLAPYDILPQDMSWPPCNEEHAGSRGSFFALDWEGYFSLSQGGPLGQGAA
mmetsp:Transcript_39237/g.95379  ORF Transcript_39237/g.95379 Transcript_39237/m.95379 type:complete len:209 (-) Transcript_39237:329-955(-)